jgi:hypothetical protein
MSFEFRRRAGGRRKCSFAFLFDTPYMNISLFNCLNHLYAANLTALSTSSCTTNQITQALFARPQRTLGGR